MTNRVSLISNYDQLALANPEISIEPSSCNIHFNWYWLMLFRLLGLCSGACVADSREDSSQEKLISPGLQYLSNFGVERELWQ
ncbi:MAG TPA: hypothetical protein V6D15_04840 [Oculatellaceae cyanobacterium]|jgi:hypothetical protein